MAAASSIPDLLPGVAEGIPSLRSIQITVNGNEKAAGLGPSAPLAACHTREIARVLLDVFHHSIVPIPRGWLSKAGFSSPVHAVPR